MVDIPENPPTKSHPLSAKAKQATRSQKELSECTKRYENKKKKKMIVHMRSDKAGLRSKHKP
jgi:hypothetical protein